MKVGKNPGEYRYVMLPELYSTLDQDKVINEAAIRSGVNEGVMRACWDGAGKVIKAWATEGHSVALPGLGTMRFGLRAKAVEDVNDVKASLIKTRRIIFTPTQELKDELKDTAIQITCYDRNGEEVKRVTSADTRTAEQKATMRLLLEDLHQRYPRALVVGHHDLDPKKACPCFDVVKEFSFKA